MKTCFSLLVCVSIDGLSWGFDDAARNVWGQ